MSEEKQPIASCKYKVIASFNDGDPPIEVNCVGFLRADETYRSFHTIRQRQKDDPKSLATRGLITGVALVDADNVAIYHCVDEE